MTRIDFAGNYDAAGLQQSSKNMCGELSRGFYGERLADSCILQRDRSPEQHFIRSRITMNANLVLSGGGGHNVVVEFVIVAGGINCDCRFLARLCSRTDFHEQYIVIEAERRNRSAINPLQIILRPAFGIAFRGIKRVIANQVSINDLHAFLGHLTSQIFQYLRMRRDALGLELIGHDAAGDIRVATAHNHHVAL